MPAPHRLPAATLHHFERPAGFGDVIRRVGDHQHRVHARHRHHADLAGERAALLGAKRLLQRVGEIGGVAILNREQCVTLAGQRIDVEGAHEIGQSIALRGFAADDQTVAGRHGNDARAALRVGLQGFGQVLGRCIMQRHQHAARSAGAAGNAGRRGGGQHAIDAPGFHQRRTVLLQQRLQHRDQLRAVQRHDGAQRGRAMHRRIDRVVQMQAVAENLRRDLPDIRIGEIEGNGAAAGLTGGTAQTDGRSRNGADGHARVGMFGADRAADPRASPPGIGAQWRQRRQHGRCFGRARGATGRQQQRGGKADRGPPGKPDRRKNWAGYPWTSAALAA